MSSFEGFRRHYRRGGPEAILVIVLLVGGIKAFPEGQLKEFSSPRLLSLDKMYGLTIGSGQGHWDEGDSSHPRQEEFYDNGLDSGHGEEGIAGDEDSALPQDGYSRHHLYHTLGVAPARNLENLDDGSHLTIQNLLSRVRNMSVIKRGIDFGLGRGFSGSQAAKHFLGMAAAQYSGGPGRKKRALRK